MASSNEFGLKRILNLPGVIAIAIGQTIGAGIFALTGLAIDFTGPSTVLAYFLAVIPIIVLMLLLATLASTLPTTGGNYKYSSRLFSPRFAFLGIWAYIAGALLGAFPLYALSGAQYLQAAFDLPTIPTALIILTAIYLINIMGISLAVAIQGTLVALLMSSLVYFSWAGWSHIDWANFTPFLPHGLSGLAIASSILTFTYIGSNAIVELGGEIKNPGSTIPKAFAISIPIVTVFYLLIIFVAIGVTPYYFTAGQPLTAAAQVFMSTAGLNYFIFAGAMLAIITSLNASFMWGTKSLLVMTGDGFFPAVFLKVSKKFATPYYFLTAIYVTSFAAILFLGEDFLQSFAILGSLGGIIIFLPLIGAAYFLPQKAPKAYAKSKFKLQGRALLISCAVSLILALIIVVILLVDLSQQPYGIAFSLFFVLWIIIGAIFYQVRENFLNKQGKSLQLLKNFKEEDF